MTPAHRGEKVDVKTEEEIGVMWNTSPGMLAATRHWKRPGIGFP